MTNASRKIAFLEDCVLYNSTQDYSTSTMALLLGRNGIHLVLFVLKVSQRLTS